VGCLQTSWTTWSASTPTAIGIHWRSSRRRAAVWSRSDQCGRAHTATARPFVSLMSSRLVRLIIFDKRGTGSSDRVSGAPSLQEGMDDLRAVMDDVGSSSAAIYGVADGASMSLPLCGYVSRADVRARALASEGALRLGARFSVGADRRRVRARNGRDGGRLGHDRGTTRNHADPRALDTRTSSRGRARAEDERESRRGTGSEKDDVAIDLRSILPAIHVPTLVMHGPADRGRSAQAFDEANATSSGAQTRPAQRVVGRERLFGL
jgi:pimeloyl-ACP methyl ester carboxylesterase